jgi:hypothetical protein
VGGGALEKAAGLLGARFTVSTLLPVSLFIAGVLALVVQNVGWPEALDWWRSLRGEERILLIVGAVLAAIVTAMLLTVRIGTLIRLYEGYWPVGPGRWLNAVGVAWQRVRFRRLQAVSEADDGTTLMDYPPDEESLLPTRFGNAFKSAESYPAEPGRWGADGSFWWPRLYCVLPDHMRATVADVRGSMDLMLFTSALAWLFAAGAATFYAVSGSGGPSAWAIAVGAPLVLGWIAYRSAVGAAISLAELTRTCFDVYRLDLVRQLGIALPKSLGDEFELWQNLTQQLYRGYADESKFEYAAKEPPVAEVRLKRD